VPTFHSFAAYERELGAWQKDMATEGRRKITRAQGEEMQRIAKREASADLGGDPKFSGWAPSLDTQLKRLSNGDTLFTPTRSSAGPWTVAEQGRNAAEGPRPLQRLTKTGRVSKARQKRWNGRTKGKHTATRVIREMDRRTVKVGEPIAKRVTAKHFDVS
jgi:hypothetical protein